MVDEGDRAMARIDQLRVQVVKIFEQVDELLPLMNDDELLALVGVLEQIAARRRRGGHSLN